MSDPGDSEFLAAMPAQNAQESSVGKKRRHGDPNSDACLHPFSADLVRESVDVSVNDSYGRFASHTHEPAFTRLSGQICALQKSQESTTSTANVAMCDLSRTVASIRIDQYSLSAQIESNADAVSSPEAHLGALHRDVSSSGAHVSAWHQSQQEQDRTTRNMAQTASHGFANAEIALQSHQHPI